MNVVLLCAHGLNCHWLGPFGNEWVSTPAWDQLAGEAICFDQHYAEAPTPAGYAQFLSSFAALNRTLQTQKVFTTLLDDRRTTTIDPRSWDSQMKPAYEAHPLAAEARVTAFEEAVAQLPKQQPWFWCIESDRMLPPWDADTETYLEYAQNVGGFTEGSESDENPDAEPWNEPPIGPLLKPTDAVWHRLRNTFATTLNGFDAELEMLCDILSEQGQDRSTAIILTSGYGFALGEHDWLGHATVAPYEEFAHMPLLIRLPNGKWGNRRVTQFTQHADLTPTILDLMGRRVEQSPPSLLPLIHGHATGRPHALSVVETEQGPCHALRVPDWAYIKPPHGEPTLFQKPDDRWEISDLARPQPGTCDELDALLCSLTKEPSS